MKVGTWTLTRKLNGDYFDDTVTHEATRAKGRRVNYSNLSIIYHSFINYNPAQAHVIKLSIIALWYFFFDTYCTLILTYKALAYLNFPAFNERQFANQIANSLAENMKMIVYYIGISKSCESWENMSIFVQKMRWDGLNLSLTWPM